jgi:hypothetical protein
MAASPDPTYPPLDLPKPVADGIWIVDSGPIHPGGMALPVRMTVVRLASGGLWLHSPTRCSDALLAAIQAIGPVRHLVAPSMAHWIFVKDWQARCPDAITWATPKLRERAEVKQEGVRLDRDLGGAPPAEWAGEIDQVVVPGGFGFREAAFLHRSSETLILTDLLQNLEPEKLSWRARLFARLVGTLAPDGKAPAYLRLIVMLRRNAARAAAQTMLGWAPERVIFSHGRWFERDGAAELRRALRWLAG